MSGITGLSDKARGTGTRNEIVYMRLIDESDFATSIVEWPDPDIHVNASGLITGLMSAVLLPATFTLGLPVYKFSIQTGSSAGRKNKGKGAGYENYTHEGLKGKFIGLTPAQWVALNKTNNKPVVAIVYNADGTARVWGSKLAPLQVMFDEQQDVKGTTLAVTFEPTGVHTTSPPFIDPALAMPPIL